MSLVSTENRGPVRVITYANAPFGTITAAGSAEMFSAIADAGEDPLVRVIVVTGGVSGIFIRHYDVGELSDAADAVQSAAPRSPSPPNPRPPGFHALTDMIAAVEKPVIAAINGLCMGGGFELSLACDLRIAANTVSAIGLPETRLGIFPGGGGTQRLPRIIGEAKAVRTKSGSCMRLSLTHSLAPWRLAPNWRAEAPKASHSPNALPGLLSTVLWPMVWPTSVRALGL